MYGQGRGAGARATTTYDHTDTDDTGEESGEELHEDYEERGGGGGGGFSGDDEEAEAGHSMYIVHYGVPHTPLFSALISST